MHHPVAQGPVRPFRDDRMRSWTGSCGDVSSDCSDAGHAGTVAGHSACRLDAAVRAERLAWHMVVAVNRGT